MCIRLSLVLCLLLTGCNRVSCLAPDQLAAESFSWAGGESGWEIWGAGGDSLFAVHSSPSVAEVWQWDGDTLKRCRDLRLDMDAAYFSTATRTRWICRVYDSRKKLAEVCLGAIDSGEVLLREQVSKDVFLALGRESQSGGRVAVWSCAESNSPDHSGAVRFGLAGPDDLSFKWAAPLYVEFNPPQAMIHQLVPSDDGAYIGIAGWENGVAMIDVANKKALWAAGWANNPKLNYPKNEKANWNLVPLDEVDTKDLAFGPDSKIVYAGGATGCVYGLEVKTGKVVSSWWATESGKTEYGHRISTISVSPDGRFVAAGTGPEGLVFLFSTQDGKAHVLRHGGGTILITSFSPSSRRLATCAAGVIKLWDMPP